MRFKTCGRRFAGSAAPPAGGRRSPGRAERSRPWLEGGADHLRAGGRGAAGRSSASLWRRSPASSSAAGASRAARGMSPSGSAARKAASPTAAMARKGPRTLLLELNSPRCVAPLKR
ncbi:unnamed protein product [Prorocentrum cordatum]|uniref:Uncharacterized protein n=1 Tax=Prorocentrum cordatum TaxID=2364126 RepID=A0ABN9SVG7_9DINO|nr:unnamed protein product [Polarella glacialis]